MQGSHSCRTFFPHGTKDVDNSTVLQVKVSNMLQIKGIYNLKPLTEEECLSCISDYLISMFQMEP